MKCPYCLNTIKRVVTPKTSSDKFMILRNIRGIMTTVELFSKCKEKGYNKSYKQFNREILDLSKGNLIIVKKRKKVAGGYENVIKLKLYDTPNKNL